MIPYRNNLIQIFKNAFQLWRFQHWNQIWKYRSCFLETFANSTKKLVFHIALIVSHTLQFWRSKHSYHVTFLNIKICFYSSVYMVLYFRIKNFFFSKLFVLNTKNCDFVATVNIAKVSSLQKKSFSVNYQITRRVEINLE